MASRPPAALDGSPSVPASAGGSPTVMAWTRCWISPSLADQPLARTASCLGVSLPVVSSWALGNPGSLGVPVPMTEGSWSVWARRSAVKRRTSSRAQPSCVRLAAATSVPTRAITASVTGKAVARYQGRRRSTVGIRGPVAGRRTGRPWLRLLLPLIATLATPLPSTSVVAPIRASLPLAGQGLLPPGPAGLDEVAGDGGGREVEDPHGHGHGEQADRVLAGGDDGRGHYDHRH